MKDREFTGPVSAAISASIAKERYEAERDRLDALGWPARDKSYGCDPVYFDLNNVHRIRREE